MKVDRHHNPLLKDFVNNTLFFITPSRPQGQKGIKHIVRIYKFLPCAHREISGTLLIRKEQGHIFFTGDSYILTSIRHLLIISSIPHSFQYYNETVCLKMMKEQSFRRGWEPLLLPELSFLRETRYSIDIHQINLSLTTCRTVLYKYIVSDRFFETI